MSACTNRWLATQCVQPGGCGPLCRLENLFLPRQQEEEDEEEEEEEEEDTGGPFVVLSLSLTHTHTRTHTGTPHMSVTHEYKNTSGPDVHCIL